jgi:peptidylamidoglycolate lyase
LNRRQFIRNTGLLSAAGIVSPSALTAQQADGMILGFNNKKYRLDTKWGALDATKYPVKDCHEMVQDSRGRILLLTNETKNNIIIYDRSGKLITTWGTEYPGAHGLTLFNENGQEVLFICDNNRHQVIKTTIDGRVLMTLDYPRDTGQYTKAEEYVPTETAIAANGDIYVADGYGKDFIIQYNSKGEYIRHFGGKGEKPENLKNAHGITIDNRDPKKPVLMISSRQENAFKRFEFDGKYIDTIALPGAWVCRPVIKGEYLYAAVLTSSSKAFKESGFVTILNKQNKVVSNLGGNEPVYKDNKLQEMFQTDKVFIYPHDVCIDNDENMYVAQWNSGKVYPYKLTPVH